MAETPHECFTVASTNYIRNLGEEDRRGEHIAIHYGKPPVRNNETGTVTFGLIFPLLIVSLYSSEREQVAERVAEILNAHWDSHGQHDPRDALIAQMAAALQSLIPANLCTSNANVPDDTIIPVDMTMGDVRAAVAALTAMEVRHG
ncbi:MULTISPECIES: hypothetical protein [unclassified Sphingomonas]|uniref:hypothetical protein n=1 Tax=Novosphingobium rhizosphaerae TaxID=1551649 RepID=UPI0015CAAF61